LIKNNQEKIMAELEETTEILRQSALETKSRRRKEKYCLRDFSGEVFELTEDMLRDARSFNQEEQTELAGVAEKILQKYAKLLKIK